MQGVTRWIACVSIMCVCGLGCSKKSQEARTLADVVRIDEGVFSEVVSTEGASTLTRTEAETLAIGFLQEHGSDLTQFDVHAPSSIAILEDGDDSGWKISWDTHHSPRIHDGVEVSIMAGVATIRYLE